VTIVCSTREARPAHCFDLIAFPVDFFTPLCEEWGLSYHFEHAQVGVLALNPQVEFIC
jgi:hypothetical protein